jgi:hypothetical protein
MAQRHLRQVARTEEFSVGAIQRGHLTTPTLVLSRYLGSRLALTATSKGTRTSRLWWPADLLDRDHRQRCEWCTSALRPTRRLGTRGYSGGKCLTAFDRRIACNRLHHNEKFIGFCCFSLAVSDFFLDPFPGSGFMYAVLKVRSNRLERSWNDSTHAGNLRRNPRVVSGCA